MFLADYMSFEQSLVMKLHPMVFNLLCLLGPVLLSMIGFLLVRRFVPFHLLKEHHDVAGAVFGTVGTVYGIFLAFVVATTWQYYNTTETNVSEEAVNLGILYSDASAYTPAFRDEIRSELHEYRHLVVDKEWKTLAKGQGSPEVDALLTKITNQYAAYHPQSTGDEAFFGESVRTLDLLKHLRQNRIDDASSGIIPLVWFVLLAGAVITVVFTFLFGTKNAYAQCIMTMLLTAIISLTLFSIVNLDFPFAGQVAIPPDPLAALDLGH